MQSDFSVCFFGAVGRDGRRDALWEIGICVSPDFNHLSTLVSPMVMVKIEFLVVVSIEFLESSVENYSFGEFSPEMKILFKYFFAKDVLVIFCEIAARFEFAGAFLEGASSTRSPGESGRCAAFIYVLHLCRRA